MKRNLALLLGAALIPCLLAAAPRSAPADDAAARLARELGLKPDEVRPSPVAGLYEVRKDHQFGYVTADGRYLIQGDMVDLKTGAEITRRHRREDRLAAIAALGEDNLLIFAPKPPLRTRYVVTAFTDVDCPFCRKMQSKMAEYNARGIAFRYAFFPRSGPDTESFYQAEAVWCAKDRHAALIAAMHDKRLPIPAHCDNPVAREYALGRALGLRGTPMLILPDGEMVTGYVPPDALLAHLEGKDKPDTAVSER